MTTPDAVPDAVIVTGASTGIGKAMVDNFAANGIRVFAAVRDLSTVDAHPLVTPVRLDVTSAQEARDAAEVVGEALGETRLRGILNNAGIAVGGPLEFLELDDLRRQLEVNVVGQLAVTQAFLPLLREHGKGRIVFTSSIAGRLAAPLIGPYAASKHALNGMAEALRRELKPWGIGVSVLAPATVSTPIWDKAGDDISDVVAKLSPRAVELYGAGIRRDALVVQRGSARWHPGVEGRRGSPSRGVRPPGQGGVHHRQRGQDDGGRIDPAAVPDVRQGRPEADVRLLRQ